MTPHLSIVSPVYKGEECLAELHRQVVEAAQKITPHFEIVLVDDCSPDRSWEILAQLAREDQRVQAIRLSRNFGQHRAITAGLDHARGDWVVVMDCDLQDPPQEIEKLYHKAQEGFDIVFGKRMNRKDSRGKRIRSRVFGGLMAWLTGTPFDGSVGNFSISSRRAIEAFRKYREGDRAFYLIMVDTGFSLGHIDVEHMPRFAGATSYSWGRLFRFAAQVVVSASRRPLRLSIGFGAIVSLASFVSALYLVIRHYVMDDGVAGWTSLAVLISFFFGVLFLQLGIIGLYLGKTFEESRRRPLYHIERSLNLESDDVSPSHLSNVGQ